MDTDKDARTDADYRDAPATEGVDYSRNSSSGEPTTKPQSLVNKAMSLAIALMGYAMLELGIEGLINRNG